MDITQLNCSDRATKIKLMLQITYQNIQVLSDNLAIVREGNDRCTVIEINDDYTIKGLYNTFNIQDYEYDVTIISYNNGEKFGTILKLKNTAYIVYDTQLGTMVDKYYTCIFNCATDDGNFGIIVISTLTNDLLFASKLQQPPLEPYCSVGKIQFLTPGNKVYAIDKFGNLIMQDEFSWKYVKIVNTYTEEL